MAFLLCEFMHYIPTCTFTCSFMKIQAIHVHFLCALSPSIFRELFQTHLYNLLWDNQCSSGRRKPGICRHKYMRISDSWKEIKPCLVPRLAERSGAYIMSRVSNLWLRSKAMAENSSHQSAWNQGVKISWLEAKNCFCSKERLGEESIWEQAEQCYLFTITEDLPSRSSNSMNSLTEITEDQLLTFPLMLHLMALEKPFRWL